MHRAVQVAGTAPYAAASRVISGNLGEANEESFPARSAANRCVDTNSLLFIEEVSWESLIKRQTTQSIEDAS